MEQKEEKLNLKERYVQLRKGVGVKKEEDGGNGEEEEWRRRRMEKKHVKQS
jgi:hypothetical protein